MKMRYDVVVVGAGTAGCVVAARLSEDTDLSVLLLEAGGDDRRPDITNPERWAENQGTDADWGFVSTVQAGTGRAHGVPRGKVLGGSGAINCMTHLRGHRYDFEEWERLGATGWDYGGVLPYFMRSEHVPDGDRRYRGTGGPLHPTIVGNAHPAAETFLEAAVRVGHPRADDFNGADLIGAGYSESLVVAGERETTATAYLRAAMERPNLTVRTDARVLGLDIEAGRCRGVRIASGSGAETIAAGEVIVSAGAVGSPQLLQLSGIGAAGDLSAIGIDVRNDLPGVGKNLQDHILLAGIRFRPERPITGSGHGATVFGRVDDGAHGPDLHTSVLAADYHMPWQQPAPGSLTFTIGQMRPSSRGSVRLASTDPLAAPLIDFGYLTDESDLSVLIKGIEQVDEIVRAGAFDHWGGRSDTTRLLALDQAGLENAVRDCVSSYFHLAGTCRMGSGYDTVVDAELRVHGIEGLRVADTSVMPTIVSCNTNAAAVMVAEKAADLIRGRSLRAPIAIGQSPAPRIPGRRHYRKEGKQ